MLLMPLCRLPTNNATFFLCGNPKCILIPDAGRSRPPDLNSRVSVLPCFTLNRPAPRPPSHPCMGEPRSFDRGSGFLNFSTSSCRFVIGGIGLMVTGGCVLPLRVKSLVLVCCVSFGVPESHGVVR